MPKKNLDIKYEIDEKFDAMNIGEIQELLASDDEKLKKEYLSYLTRKSHKARSKFNGGRRPKTNVDIHKINNEWDKKIEFRKTIDGTLEDYEAERNRGAIVGAKKKSKKTNSPLQVYINSFRKTYKIDILKVVENLESTVLLLNSDIRLAKFQKGPKKTYNYTIDDSKKEEFYKIYKQKYKEMIANAYKLMLSKKRIEPTAEEFNKFAKGYDKIIREVINIDKNISVPSFGGMNQNEFKEIFKNILDIKYVDDSHYDRYLRMPIKNCSNLKSNEIKSILETTHKDFVQTLKGAQTETDPLVQGQRVLESVKKSYLTINKIHSSHGFWFKHLHSKTYKREQQYLDAIRNVCVAKFKIDNEPLDNNKFIDYMCNPFEDKEYFVFSKENSLEQIGKGLIYTLTNDNILESNEEYLEEDKILEVDEEKDFEEVKEEQELDNKAEVKDEAINQNRININVDLKDNNVINDKVEPVEEKVVVQNELKK